MSKNNDTMEITDEIKEDAIKAFLRQCIANKELLAEYDRLRGTNLSGRGAPINLMIDAACGKTEADVKGFCDFCMDFLMRMPPPPPNPSLATT